MANLIVDNSQNPNGVQWTAGNGELSAGHGVNLLSIDGASSVQVLGGTGSNTLSAVSSGPTNGTIDGNMVTLVAGKDVLQPSDFNTYNDFSELNQILNFSVLAANSTSYTQYLASGFRLHSGQHRRRPGAQYEHQQRRGGQHAEHGLHLDSQRRWTLRPLRDLAEHQRRSQHPEHPDQIHRQTADGLTVTQMFPVSQSAGFENFLFPAAFTALTKVTWTPGSTLATNVVVSELYPAVVPGPNPGTVPTVSGTSGETIVVDASSQGGSITLNNTNLTGTPNSASNNQPLNGTPWYSQVDQTDKLVDFYFQGDLYLPDKTTMTITGDYGAVFEVGGNILVGQNVTINASANGSTPGPGGGSGGTSGEGGPGGTGGDGGQGGAGGAGGSAGDFLDNGGNGQSGGNVGTAASGRDGGSARPGTAEVRESTEGSGAQEAIPPKLADKGASPGAAEPVEVAGTSVGATGAPGPMQSPKGKTRIPLVPPAFPVRVESIPSPVPCSPAAGAAARAAAEWRAGGGGGRRRGRRRLRQRLQP